MASKRRLRRKSCGRKKAYPDNDSAWTAAKTVARKEDTPMVAYHCSFCGRWHVAHKRRFRFFTRKARK